MQSTKRHTNHPVPYFSQLHPVCKIENLQKFNIYLHQIIWKINIRQ